MFTFFKDSLNELSHVVWPTKKESVTYMKYVVGVIVTMTIILFIFGYIFRGILFEGRTLKHGEIQQTPVNNMNPNGNFELPNTHLEENNEETSAETNQEVPVENTPSEETSAENTSAQ